MEMVQYLGRAVARLRARGLGDVSRYALHVIKERAYASAIDLVFGGKMCRTDLNESIYTNGRHTMVHTDYHVLRDIFARVPVTPDDVLVDVGCGEGRVINFWLSRRLTNPGSRPSKQSRTKRGSGTANILMSRSSPETCSRTCPATERCSISTIHSEMKS
jgi:hypothetical protein